MSSTPLGHRPSHMNRNIRENNIAIERYSISESHFYQLKMNIAHMHRIGQARDMTVRHVLFHFILFPAYREVRSGMRAVRNISENDTEQHCTELQMCKMKGNSQQEG